jgi:cellulose biosynthesis protein BcsQ
LRFVVNQLAPRTTLAKEVQETLADADIAVMPTYIHDRQLYRQTVAQGSSVMNASGPARAEMLALMKDVLDALNTPA